jgi:hypothetical protein
MVIATNARFALVADCRDGQDEGDEGRHGGHEQTTDNDGLGIWDHIAANDRQRDEEHHGGNGEEQGKRATPEQQCANGEARDRHRRVPRARSVR